MFGVDSFNYYLNGKVLLIESFNLLDKGITSSSGMTNLDIRI